MQETFSIRNMTKSKLTGLPFLEMKNQIVGKKYELSLVFIGERKSRLLNKQFKNKTTSANVLSFPLSNTDGEIFITPERAYKQSKKFNKTKKQMIGFLVIHGLLHLKGMSHGSRMEQAERKFCKLFKV